MIKITDARNKTYQIKIKNIEINGDDTFPLARTILTGIIDWQRKNVSSIYLGTLYEKYVLTFSGNNVHLVEESSWSRHKQLIDSARNIADNLIRDIEENKEMFAAFDAETDEEIKENISEIERLLLIIRMYMAATGEVIDFEKREKADKCYKEYILSLSDTAKDS